ncbi:MAG: hypothetical protein LBR25_00580 [Erysipelotrichaceae bacterium]|jgi:hypothetical protein|nr:hypothetical protein [Erysipelotrichaceae bacterium]
MNQFQVLTIAGCLLRERAASDMTQVFAKWVSTAQSSFTKDFDWGWILVGIGIITILYQVKKNRDSKQ